MSWGDRNDVLVKRSWSIPGTCMVGCSESGLPVRRPWGSGIEKRIPLDDVGLKPRLLRHTVAFSSYPLSYAIYAHLGIIATRNVCIDSLMA